MNKNLRFAIILSYWLGLLIYTLSSIFRDYLTDFTLGFCEGISVSLMVIGVIYFGWCLAKKKNPFKIE